MCKKSRSGSVIIIFQRAWKQFFGVKKHKFFDANPDPGSGIFLTLDPRSGLEVSRIRDKHPGSPTLSGKIQKSGSKNLSILTRKMVFSCRIYDPGFSFRIPEPDPDFSSIPNPGVKKAPDPGSAK
jgi:hypothetical protein